VGMRRHPRDMDLSAAQMDEKEDVIGYQPTPRPHLSSEEVRRDQEIEVCADKLLPRGGALAFWRRRDTVTLEDVPHRLVADRIAQVGEGADDPIVAPGTILLSHAHDQGLQLWINGGTPWGLALCRAVKLLGHQFAVPAENRVGLDDRGHVL